MDNKLTPELIEKAKTAHSPEELLSMARENGIELTNEQAAEGFERLQKQGALSDEELDGVSGGGCGGPKYPAVNAYGRCEHWRCYKCAAKISDPNIQSHTCNAYLSIQCRFCVYAIDDRGMYYCKYPEMY